MSEFTQAYMGRDRDGLTNILSEDFTWYLHEGDEDSPNGKVVHGVEGMLGEMKLRATRWQDVSYTEIQVYATESMITQTFRIQGTDIEQGHFDRYGVDLYQIRGGKIVSKNSHWKRKREG